MKSVGEREKYLKGIRGNQFRPRGLIWFCFNPRYRGSRVSGLPRWLQGIAVTVRNFRLFWKPSGIPMTYASGGLATKAVMSFLEDENFIRAYERMITASGFPNDPGLHFRIHQALWAASIAMKIDGDFVECGTGRGLTFTAVLESLSDWSESGRHLWLFDTFSPFHLDPKTGKNDAARGQHDRYAVSEESTQVNFSEWKNVHLVAGLLPESLSALPNDTKISFLHIDLNNAKSEASVVEKLWSRMSIGGVILLDDYATNNAQNSAMNDCFKAYGAQVLTSGAGQGIVIKH
jgi:hypothetical protein